MFITKTKKLILISGINFLFLFLFLILGEFTYRTFYFLKFCKFEMICNFNYYLPQKKLKDKFNWGIHKPDKTLGFENKENITTYIDSKKTTTFENGLRGGFTNDSASTKILTVGDSFAFGYGANDDETWQSCLNKKSKNKYFLNGGVGGYGTGQAILKAKKIYPKIKPNLLLVQTLVGHNFYRDTLKNRVGFPKPYFSKISQDKIVAIPPTPRNEYMKSFKVKNSPLLIDYLIVNYTLLKRLPKESFLYGIWEKSYSKFDPMGSSRGENHASKLEIINWAVKESKKLDPNVVWLLQYSGNFKFSHQKERESLINILSNEKVRFIDTFDHLHGKFSENYPKQEIWLGHHTPLGNKIVCKAILDSKIYK